MADTLTTNLKLTNQTEGGNNNTWGSIADANFEEIDDKFGDTTDISTTGGDTTLTDAQEIVAAIQVAGTLASNANIIFSGRGGVWIIDNNTSGDFTVTCKVSGQTGVAITQGSAAIVFCDGTDIVAGNPQSALAIADFTAITDPAVGDLAVLGDASDSNTSKKITLANLWKIITSLTAETSPATDDELALYDTSGSSTDKITLANLLKVVNALTEDTSPDSASDFVLSYDASASAAKKVTPANLGAVILAALLASQSNMETATSTTTIVSPGRQHYHPGHPKAGGQFDGTAGSPAFASGDYGMGAITDNGSGSYTLALDTAFANTNYWATGIARDTSTRNMIQSLPNGGTKTTSSFQVRTGVADDAANSSDSSEVGITLWGDYA